MENIHNMNWQQIYCALHTKGYALLPSVLSKEECEHISGLYGDHDLYRNTIDMKRYRFGNGEYRYFKYPLPPSIHVLREVNFIKP
jgi:hypothetical protein